MEVEYSLDAAIPEANFKGTLKNATKPYWCIPRIRSSYIIAADLKSTVLINWETLYLVKTRGYRFACCDTDNEELVVWPNLKEAKKALTQVKKSMPLVRKSLGANLELTDPYLVRLEIEEVQVKTTSLLS